MHTYTYIAIYIQTTDRQKDKYTHTHTHRKTRTHTRAPLKLHTHARMNKHTQLYILTCSDPFTWTLNGYSNALSNASQLGTRDESNLTFNITSVLELWH